ncbi:dihydroxyacetone phosphate acyltransferase [Ischnura elegans]|uniref:dihydroxyacetone phosphate acyltransferase n=1 Tax=Ischnura elegans TaxID=197161 RepID=UPI001ED8B068|nr:dihydroxyacetone phosphate acyltransferase [Ischnura elegans]
MSNTARSLKEFRDIIGERYHSSDIFWVSREWRPSPSYRHAKKRTPYEVKLDIMMSPRIQHVVEEAAEDRKTPQELLYKEVDSILDEMGHKQQLPVIRWFGYFLTKVMKRIYSGVLVNSESIERMRDVMPDTPIILVPSHRSYADFLLLSYICFHFNISLPVIAAGMDFVSMWGIGRMLRDSGAFFIRRSFGNDKVYWAVFSEYVQSLVRFGEAPMEFFIEGTRSRSGKSLTPKLGFLSVALECFFSGHVPDVVLVPVNISYDRTLEEVLYAYELLGVPKPKESTSGLFKALRMLDEQYGRIHVDFAPPVSARLFCASVGLLDEHRSARAATYSPCLPHTPLANESRAVTDLAYHLVRQQQFNTVLSPFSLVALVLSNHLALSATDAKLGSIQVSEVVREVKWFKSVVETLGALVAIEGDVEKAVLESLKIHQSLVHLTPSNTLQLVKIHSPSVKINPSNLKGHNMSNKTLEIAVSMVMLQHYVNQVLHYLVNPAIITVVMQNLQDRETITKDDLFAKYKFLRSLLSYDFILHKPWEVKDYEEGLKQLDLLNIIEEVSPGNLVLGNHKKLQIILCNLMMPFLSSYEVVCQVVKQEAIEPCSSSKIVRCAQKRAEQCLYDGSLVHPQSLSLDIFNSALSSLVAMGGLKKLRDNGNVKYIVCEEKLDEISNELRKYLLQPEKKDYSYGRISSDYMAEQQKRAKL